MNELYLDIGNTRAKWLLIDKLGLAKNGAVTLVKGRANSNVLRSIADVVGFVAISCVKDGQFIKELSECAFSVWGVRPKIAETKPEQQGLECAYKDYSRLGVDRWLGMLAAWRTYRSAVCVVDCGSATTIDLVALDGSHLGGFILPGLRLGIDGLLKGTDRVLVDSDKLNDATPSLAKNTTDAVYNGALFSVVATVNSAFDLLQEHEQGLNCALVLTGGDGSLLSGLFRMDAVYHEGLVLQGLKLYFDS